MKLLMHTCCAPCSIYCIDSLRGEGIEPILYWFNPNIHPYMEYKARRDTLKQYTDMINIEAIFEENYGLKEFCKNVVDDLFNGVEINWADEPQKIADIVVSAIPLITLKEMNFEQIISDKETIKNIVTNVEFLYGGCPGNLQALPRLVEGLTVEEIISSGFLRFFCPFSQLAVAF